MIDVAATNSKPRKSVNQMTRKMLTNLKNIVRKRMIFNLDVSSFAGYSLHMFPNLWEEG